MGTTSEKSFEVRGVGKLDDQPTVPVTGKFQLASELGIVRSIRAVTKDSRQPVHLGRDNTISILSEGGALVVNWSVQDKAAIEEGMEIRIRHDA